MKKGLNKKQKKGERRQALEAGGILSVKEAGRNLLCSRSKEEHGSRSRGSGPGATGGVGTWVP